MDWHLKEHCIIIIKSKCSLSANLIIITPYHAITELLCHYFLGKTQNVDGPTDFQVFKQQSGAHIKTLKVFLSVIIPPVYTSC